MWFHQRARRLKWQLVWSPHPKTFTAMGQDVSKDKIDGQPLSVLLYLNNQKK